MSNLVVIAFEKEHKAFELRAELVKLQKEYLIKMEDAVVVTKDNEGKVKLHQAVNLTAAGAVGGTFWGALIGLIFLNPLVGAAVGAGAGALSGEGPAFTGTGAASIRAGWGAIGSPGGTTFSASTDFACSSMSARGSAAVKPETNFMLI